MEICQHAGAKTYLTGPLAQNYIETDTFDRVNIALEYMSYDGYPEYEQNSSQFDPYVSIIDLIMNTGPNAPRYMKSISL